MPTKRLFFLLLLLITKLGNAQTVWENPKNEVISYLQRQAQKGNIELQDYIQPISRNEIGLLLRELKEKPLSTIEKKELDFYLKDFNEFDSLSVQEIKILKRDHYGRLRFLTVNKDDYILRGDPIITFDFIQSPVKSIYKQSTGVSFYGYAGKHFGVQMSFREINEYGSGLDSLKDFTPETGIIKTKSSNPMAKAINYTELEGYLSYSFKNGQISIGKDQNLFGYGENGRIISSSKAPAYPLIRFDFHPLKWFRFNYSHAWLQSGIIDSVETYTKGNDIYGAQRNIYREKFIVSHSFNFIPVKNLVLSLGESMVYSDKLDFAYFIPILFFKSYDQYKSRNDVLAGSNGQFFFQASSRNHLKNTHLYGTIFIDEIRLSEIFNSAKSRNQLGFNFGGSVTDLFIPYLTFGGEYTRINPFVYKNFIPSQTYENQNYSLGDWMGNNADRLIAYVKYTPIPKLKTELYFQNVRKGDEGTLGQQYFAVPQPPFLFNLQRQQTTLSFSMAYELMNNLYFNTKISNIVDKEYKNNTENKYSQFQFSIRYGL
ncbi:MAG: capsule assembly Wzi family protein [Candidatus Dojkabacteria bacterium]